MYLLKVYKFLINKPIFKIAVQQSNSKLSALIIQITNIRIIKYRYKMNPLTNPYSDLYRTHVKQINAQTSMQQAEIMATQMSLMYHAFGGALKDLVGLLSYLYNAKGSNSSTQINSQTVRQEGKQKQLGVIQEGHQIREYQVNSSIMSNNNSQNQNSASVIKQPDFSKYMIKSTKPHIKQHQNNNSRNKPTLRIPRPQHFSQPLDQSSNNSSKSKPIQRVQVVRGKIQRENLNGYSCLSCEKFYKALGQDYIDFNGNNKLCNDCSRHRSNLPPTNYYNTDYSQEFGFD